MLTPRRDRAEHRPGPLPGPNGTLGQDTPLAPAPLSPALTQSSQPSLPSLSQTPLNIPIPPPLQESVQSSLSLIPKQRHLRVKRRFEPKIETSL